MSSIAQKLEEETKQMEDKLYGKPAKPAAKPEEKKEEPEVTEEPSVDAEPDNDDTEDLLTSQESNDEHEEDNELEAKDKKTPRTDWKKRYRNFKASADATIYQLRQQNANLSEENLELSEKLEELTTQLRETSQQTFQSPLTDEEREILGDDAVSSLQKLVDAKVAAIVSPIKEELKAEKEARKKEREQEVKATRQANNSSFISRLEELVPDCVEIDKNRDFLAWMDEGDSVSGLSRKYIFQQAQAIGDVGRVAQFFKDWKSMTNQGTETLDKHISPSKTSKTTQKPVQKKPEVITYAQIIKFYDDVARGEYRGKEKLKQELENKYNAALASRAVR